MRPRPTALHRYGVRAEDEAPFPVAWERRFGRVAPLAVEVGFGGGEFLAWWARQRPEWNLVGLERPPECLARAAARLEGEDLSNVRLVRGDARTLLRELFAPASLEHVLMQFPMPWPKERQAKHRVSGPRLAATLADVLRPGGVFELVTDQEWYAAEAHEVLATAGCFELGPLERAPLRPFHTRYERKWLAEGRNIFRLAATLRRGAPAARLFLEEAMHCVHLPCPPCEASVLALAGRRFAAAGAVVEVKEIFRAADSWLLRVVSADGAFSQIHFLRVAPRGAAGGLVKVEAQPRPYPTPAVRLAVEAIAQALAAAA